MPIPHRNGSFHGNAMRRLRVRGIRPRFRGLSPCAGQVAYVLLTSAPVAAGRIAAPALPLDLHVLSLSLAFILSQDQTLRCCILVFFSLQEKRPARHEAQGNVASRVPRRAFGPRPVSELLCTCSLSLLGVLLTGTAVRTDGAPALSRYSCTTLLLLSMSMISPLRRKPEFSAQKRCKITTLRPIHQKLQQLFSKKMQNVHKIAKNSQNRTNHYTNKLM